MPKIWNKYSQKRNIGASVPISTFMCLWAAYILPQWVCLFCCRKYVDRSWEYINRSQTHKCVNWGWGRAIPKKGIYKRNCRCSAPACHPFLRSLPCSYTVLLFPFTACFLHLPWALPCPLPSLPPCMLTHIVPLLSAPSPALLQGFLPAALPPPHLQHLSAMCHNEANSKNWQQSIFTNCRAQQKERGLRIPSHSLFTQPFLNKYTDCMPITVSVQVKNKLRNTYFM